MLHTTFRKAKEAGACTASYKKMARALGGVRKYGQDTPVPLDKILEVCGLDDALWSLRIILEPADREIRLLACDFAARVLPSFEKKYPEDKRPRRTIEVARRFANGRATQDELRDAWDAARAAWAAAWDARDAAWDAARATWVAWAVARDVAWDAAWDARDAAWDAARAARDATGDAAWAATDAWAAERDWQRQRFLRLLRET